MFTALQTVEKLLVSQSKKVVVGEIARLGLANKCLLFAQYHATHWIRLIAQRIFGHLFAFHREQQESGQKRMELFEILGLEVPEHLVTFTMQLVECLRKHLVLEEQKDQFVKNLVYLVNEQLNSTDSNIQKDFQVEKLFGKVSFIGRKLMLDSRTATDRLETVLCFFSISLQLFQQTGEDPQSETSPTRLTCFSILNLTQRLSTDQQYASHDKIKETALTI